MVTKKPKDWIEAQMQNWNTNRVKPGFLLNKRIDCEQSLLFFRFSEGSASERERRSRERRETRALVTRVVICVSRTFYSTDQEKRETARSLMSETRVFFQNSHYRHMHPPSLLWGTFHLSKLTGQKIPVIMIISLVIRTIHRDPKWHARRNGVSTKTLGKKRFLLSKWLVRLWSGRSVLTFGKGPKGASLNVIVYCQFNKAYKTTCDEYVWHSFYNHYSDIFISIILHKAKHTIWRSLENTGWNKEL